MDDKKKRRRRRSIVGWVVALSCLTAVGVVGAVTPLAVQRGGAHDGAPAPAAFAPPAWLSPAQARVQGQGYDWLTLGYGGRIVTVNGDAPDQPTADRAFEAAEGVLRADAQAAAGLDLVVNNITTAGAAGVGSAFAALGASPDVAACQQAFVDTLAGRFVGFEVGSARITRDSAQLLNALTAVAKRCEAHRIEIAGHTDLSGSPSRNMLLSEDRAMAVRAYLMERGVAAETLGAVGYGDTRPLVAERSDEADNRNRRIEFTVSGL